MPAVNLSPIWTGAQFFDAVGRVLAGGLINTYQAGTSTPLATYTTTAGSITNSNPIVIGSDGRLPAEIWLVAGSSYKFVLTDSLLNVLATLDDLMGIGDLGSSVLIPGNLAVSGTTSLTDLQVTGNTTIGNGPADGLAIASNAVSWTGNPTHSGNHTFSGNVTVNGATAVANMTVSGAITATGVVTQNANPAGRTVGNTYTPTTTNILNVSASTALPSFYIRMGPVVSVTGGVTATTSGAGSATVNLSLPVASVFASTANAIGVVSTTSATTHLNGSISAVTVSNVAQLNWTCTGAGSTTLFFEFKYLVI